MRLAFAIAYLVLSVVAFIAALSLYFTVSRATRELKESLKARERQVQFRIDND